MISKQDFKNLIHKIHIDSFVDSHKRLHEDNRGGFLIPIEFKIKDKEYERYRHLPVNWSISPITKNDLPKEFSQKAVNTVDIFRRKTFDLDVECMIYFDIDTGNVVSCNFSEEDAPNEVQGDIFVDCLKGMCIASAHNHPIQYGSPPSGKNFQMLSLDFEKYELVLSQNELWILESKDIVFDENEINKIRDTLEDTLVSTFDEVNNDFEEGYLILENVNKKYGDFLLIYLNNKLKNIKLTRRYLND